MTYKNTEASIRQELKETFVPPRDEVELQLTKIWEKVLGVQSIGVRDDFFKLGGNSLIAVRLFAGIKKMWSIDLPLDTLFEAPTIEELASVLRQEKSLSAWSSLVPIQPNGLKPPLFCIHPIGGNILNYNRLANYLGREQPVYGVQAQGLDGKQEPLSRVEDMANHYIKEIRSFQPNGPYFLAGYSFGGVVAFEMAQQLHAQGQKVALLALLDASSPNLHKTRPSLAKFVRVHLSNLRRIEPKDRLNYIRDWVQWHLNKGNYKEFLLTQLSEPIQNFKILETNLQANKDYIAQVYPGVVTLFRCSLQPVKFADYIDLGWQELAERDVEIHHTPGDHFHLLQEPNVQILAKQLNLCLKRVK